MHPTQLQRALHHRDVDRLTAVTRPLPVTELPIEPPFECGQLARTFQHRPTASAVTTDA